MKVIKFFILLLCLLYFNLNLRIKVGKDKLGLLKDCFLLLKFRLLLGDRKVLFLNLFNRDNVCGLIELNYFLQKKEYKNYILYLKDIIDFKYIV